MCLNCNQMNRTNNTNNTRAWTTHYGSSRHKNLNIYPSRVRFFSSTLMLSSSNWFLNKSIKHDQVLARKSRHYRITAFQLLAMSRNKWQYVTVAGSARKVTLISAPWSFPGNSKFVSFEVFTAVIIKNGVFWDVTSCGSCKNLRFGGIQRLRHQGDKNRWTRNVSRNQQPTHAVRRLLVTANGYVPPKRQFLQEAHGVTSNKTAFFIVADVQISNFTCKILT
jgi:hypothetical protein